MKNPFQPAKAVAKRFKILLWGGPGTGKTVAALSFPRPALIDGEGGTELYRGRPGVPPFDVLPAKSFKQLVEAVAFIEYDAGKTYDTLIIDPITVFFGVLREATAQASKNKELGYREWAKINDTMEGIYTRLSNLNVHVIVIARESTEYESGGGELRKVGVKPDSDKQMPYIFDYSIQMLPDHTGVIKKQRGWDFQPNQLLPRVNWDVFAPLAGKFEEGDPEERQSVEQAAADDAIAMIEDEQRKQEQRNSKPPAKTSDEAWKAWFGKWQTKRASREDVLRVLGVTGDKFTFKGSLDEAEQLMQAWYAKITTPPPPVDKPTDKPSAAVNEEDFPPELRDPASLPESPFAGIQRSTEEFPL